MFFLNFILINVSARSNQAYKSIKIQLKKNYIEKKQGVFIFCFCLKNVIQSFEYEYWIGKINKVTVSI